MTLFAPATNLIGAGNKSDDDVARLDVFGNPLAGTSGSAPLVAGLVARYLEKNPSAVPSTVKSAFVGNATTSTPLYESVPSGTTDLIVYSGFIDDTAPTPDTTVDPVVPSVTIRPGRFSAGQSVTVADTGISSGDGNFMLFYGDNGNLILEYTPLWSPVWMSHTDGTSVGHVDMQSDGNSVIYDADDTDVYRYRDVRVLRVHTRWSRIMETWLFTTPTATTFGPARIQEPPGCRHLTQKCHRVTRCGRGTASSSSSTNLMAILGSW